MFSRLRMSSDPPSRPIIDGRITMPSGSVCGFRHIIDAFANGSPEVVELARCDDLARLLAPRSNRVVETPGSRDIGANIWPACRPCTRPRRRSRIALRVMFRPAPRSQSRPAPSTDARLRLRPSRINGLRSGRIRGVATAFISRSFKPLSRPECRPAIISLVIVHRVGWVGGSASRWWRGRRSARFSAGATFF